MILDDIQRRANVSLERYGKRNVRFADLYKAYDGDIWNTNAPADEQRLVIRLVADTVDLETALLLSRPPLLTVPVSRMPIVDEISASVLENIINGAWNAQNLHTVLYEAGHVAALTGWGVLRGPIATGNPDNPLVTYAADPRACYPGFTANKQLQWNVFQQFRTAGDIRMEMPRTIKGGKWHPNVLPEADDQMCVWSEYWGWHGRDLMHAIYVYETDEHNTGYGTVPTGLEKQGGAMSSALQPSELGNELKSPTEMSDFYPGIPWHYFFPRSHPRHEPGYEGMSMAERMIDMQKILSQLGTVLATDAFFRGNTPLYGDGQILWPVDDAGHGVIDTRPHGYTYVSPGTKILPLPGALDFNLIKSLFEMLDTIAGRSGFPATMHGQYTAAMSGMALSVLNNPVLIKEALPQKQIEACLQRYNSFLLKLLKKLPKGTSFWAQGRKGAQMQTTVGDMPQVDNVYNIVQLSASLPKDVSALITLVNQSVQQHILSQRTGAEYVQNQLDLANKDPDLEHEIVVKEMIEQTQENLVVRAMIQNGLPPQMGAQGGQMPMQPQMGGVPASVAAPQQFGMAMQQMSGQPLPQGIGPGEVSGEMGG